MVADRLIGLPESRARNHNRPQQVPALSGIHVQDIAVGAEHTLVLSSTGEVYAWGSNSEGQVTTTYTRTPLQVYLRSDGGAETSCFNSSVGINGNSSAPFPLKLSVIINILILCEVIN